MFEGIDEIDWDSLGFPSIPSLMRDFVSEKRQQAFDVLSEEIVISDAGFDNWNLHSGISRILKSDLHYFLVDYLIEALQLDEHPDNYDILISFVTYVDFVYEGEIYRQRAWEIRNEVWKGKEIFIKHLDSQDKDIRLNAFALLSRLNEYHRELVSILLDKIKAEPNVALRGELARTFYHAYVLWDLLSQDEMKIWNAIKPMIDEELFHPLYKWIYVKHEINSTDK
jgi:hypothetical protein